MPAIRLAGVTKTYGAVRANDDVHLEVEPGSIHGVYRTDAHYHTRVNGESDPAYTRYRFTAGSSLDYRSAPSGSTVTCSGPQAIYPGGFNTGCVRHGSGAGASYTQTFPGK